MMSEMFLMNKPGEKSTRNRKAKNNNKSFVLNEVKKV